MGGVGGVVKVRNFELMIVFDKEGKWRGGLRFQKKVLKFVMKYNG